MPGTFPLVEEKMNRNDAAKSVADSIAALGEMVATCEDRQALMEETLKWVREDPEKRTKMFEWILRVLEGAR